MAKPRNSKAEIIAVIKKVARKLKRPPTRKEFARLSGMTASQVKWAFGSYEAGLRAAGVRKLGPSGRIGTTQLLEDWGRVVREVGRHPSVNEYRALGKYSEVSLISRVGRWCNVRETFLDFVRSNGLGRDWADVVESLKTGPAPMPGSANGWLSRTESLVSTSKPGPASRQMQRPSPSGQLTTDQPRSGRQAILEREILLPELRGMRPVTKTMLWVLCGAHGSQATCVSQEDEAEEIKNLPQLDATDAAHRTHGTPEYMDADEGSVDQPTARNKETVPPGTALPAPLPAQLHGKRCVTRSMLWILFADEKPSMLDLSEQTPSPPICEQALRPPQTSAASEAHERGPVGLPLNLRFPRRAIPGRPMMGPPVSLNGRVPHGLVREPVNEAGVVFFFGMVAHLLGFDVEALQGAYPDGEAKLEVEPGRWQNIRFEFEYESRKFPQHRHDARKCDVIVCWKHNWKGCPEKIQVVELGKILGSPTSP